jgi:hypothetical protein
MSEAIHYDRRRFIGTAAIATADAGLVGSRLREPGSRGESSPTAIKQIDAGDLDIGYAEAGPQRV